MTRLSLLKSLRALLTISSVYFLGGQLCSHEDSASL